MEHYSSNVKDIISLGVWYLNDTSLPDIFEVIIIIVMPIKIIGLTNMLIHIMYETKTTNNVK